MPDQSLTLDQRALATSSQPSLVVATIGLHGSASTWVFNITRELLIKRFGQAHVLACYADQLTQIPDEATRVGRHLLIKSHHGSSALDDWLFKMDARMIASIRDPRDASISMAQRFEVPLSRASRWIQNDCRRLLNVAPNSRLLLRYEERFFEKQDSILRLADAIGIEPHAEDVSPIFARYRTEAVREFASSLASLSVERLTQIGPFAMDRVTQILAPHIGDARSNKWRELPDGDRISLTAKFATFIDRMGYQRE